MQWLRSCKTIIVWWGDDFPLQLWYWLANGKNTLNQVKVVYLQTKLPTNSHDPCIKLINKICNVITKGYSQLTSTFVWLLSNKTTFDYLLLKFWRCQNRSGQCLSKVKTLTAIRTSLCPHTPATVQLWVYWKHKCAENYYSWREGYFSSELLWTKFLKLEFTSRDNMVALKGCNN